MSFGDLATLPDDGWDLVINGLSSGWSSTQPELPVIVPSSRALAYDMLYGKAPTPFLLQMQDAGFSRLSDGLGMLVEQAADSYARWQGVRPNTGSVLYWAFPRTSSQENTVALEQTLPPSLILLDIHKV